MIQLAILLNTHSAPKHPTLLYLDVIVLFPCNLEKRSNYWMNNFENQLQWALLWKKIQLKSANMFFFFRFGFPVLPMDKRSKRKGSFVTENETRVRNKSINIFSTVQNTTPKLSSINFVMNPLLCPGHPQQADRWGNEVFLWSIQGILLQQWWAHQHQGAFKVREI